MNPLYRLFVCALVTATTVLALAQVRADDDPDQHNRPNRYVVTNLTSDILGVAPNTDPVLQNAWGVAFTPGASPFWIADNATGCSTLYDGQGAIASTLQVKLPLPGGIVPDTACKHADPKNPSDPPPATPIRPRVEPYHDISRAEHDPPGYIHLGYRGWNYFSLDGRFEPV